MDVEDTDAGRGMSPDPPRGHGPTYPPREPPRDGDWRTDPALAPWLDRYPTLLQLLDSPDRRTGSGVLAGGVEAVYRWAGVPEAEADAYGLASAGFTDKAVGQAMRPPRDQRTVRELIERADDRLRHSLHHLDAVWRATG